MLIRINLGSTGGMHFVISKFRQSKIGVSVYMLKFGILIWYILWVNDSYRSESVNYMAVNCTQPFHRYFVYIVGCRYCTRTFLVKDFCVLWFSSASAWQGSVLWWGSWRDQSVCSSILGVCVYNCVRLVLLFC